MIFKSNSIDKTINDVYHRFAQRKDLYCPSCANHTQFNYKGLQSGDLVDIPLFDCKNCNNTLAFDSIVHYSISRKRMK